jgi:general secretion pathway protein K
MRISVDGRATSESGGALLAVLWLAAALSVIAFSVASTVRAETERTSTTADGVRAYYLAAGSVDRAILWMYWGINQNPRNPDGSPMFYAPPMPFIRYHYASGEAVVEVIPESGKLNVNQANPVQLQQLLGALGIDPVTSARIAAGIIQWRSAAPDLGISPGGSSFRPRGSSLEELEEVLLVPGMTPDIFYGRYDHDPSGRLIPRGGLRDCLTVWSNPEKIDVNTAPAALMQSLGLSPADVQAIVALRAQHPFTSMDQVTPFLAGAGPEAQRLGIVTSTYWTLRATARVRSANGQLSDLRRTVAAVVKFLDTTKYEVPFDVLRWYDDGWSPVAAPGF